MNDDIYSDLPDDPEAAFIQLETNFRRILDERLNNADNNSPLFDYYRDYVNAVKAAADALELHAFASFSGLRRERNYDEQYTDFRLAVENFVIQTQIKLGRRIKTYSIKLDNATKEKIRHHLNQIKDFAGKLEISEPKRDAIIKKILALESEIERSRTRIEAFGDLAIYYAEVAEDVGEKLGPIRKLIDSIGNLLSKAKSKETASLPPPHKPKQIEPPKNNPNPRNRNMDDDIPF